METHLQRLGSGAGDSVPRMRSGPDFSPFFSSAFSPELVALLGPVFLYFFWGYDPELGSACRVVGVATCLHATGRCRASCAAKRKIRCRGLLLLESHLRSRASLGFFSTPLCVCVCVFVLCVQYLCPFVEPSCLWNLLSLT